MSENSRIRELDREERLEKSNEEELPRKERDGKVTREWKESGCSRIGGTRILELVLRIYNGRRASPPGREGRESRGGARRLIVRVLSNCGFRPVETRIEAICPFVAVRFPLGGAGPEMKRKMRKRGIVSRTMAAHACACVSIAIIDFARPRVDRRETLTVN